MHYVVGYSGGADSQVALDLALKKYDDVEIVFIDTSIEFPETLNTIFETAQFYGMPIKTLRAGKKFDTYLRDFGGMYPSWRRRWCTDRLKERPLKKYINSLIRESLRLNAQKEAATLPPQAAAAAAVTVIDGIRRDESDARSKRAKFEPHQTGKWDIEHIIFDWSKSKVFKYIADNRLPLNPLYAKGYSRVSCWFCPFTPIADNRLLRTTHPRLFEKAQSWEAEWGRKFNYVIEDQEQSTLP